MSNSSDLTTIADPTGSQVRLPRAAVVKRQRFDWFRAIWRMPNWLVRRFVGAGVAPLRLPWFFPITSSRLPVNRLHRLAFKYRWRYGGISKITMIARTLAWPFALLLLIASATYRNGSYVRRTYRVSVTAQVWQQFVLANLYNVPPVSYYEYRLFEDSARRETGQLIQRAEMFALFTHLHRNIDTAQLDDKLAFHRRCVVHSLPATLLVAAFAKGQKLYWHDGAQDRLPQVDLFLKPANLHRGAGVEAWRFEPSADAWHRGTARLDEGDMLHYCRAKSATRVLLVEKRIENHAEVSRLSLGGLCTVRVVTYRFPEGQPAVLLASLRMPRGSAHVDNWSAGGLAAPADLQTGVLGLAVGNDLLDGEWAHHPDTGSPIAGFGLPYWRETLELAMAAHHAFQDYVAVGWDIAITPGGPLLMEGNSPFGVRVLQIPHRLPLGKTLLVDCFLAHIANNYDEVPSHLTGIAVPKA